MKLVDTTGLEQLSETLHIGRKFSRMKFVFIGMSMSLERQFVAFEIFSDMPFENVREYIDSISNARGEEETARDSDGTERQFITGSSSSMRLSEAANLRND